MIRAAVRVRIDGAGHPHHPVGPGGPHHRGVKVVADGERLGEREMKGNVRPLVIAHHIRVMLTVGLAMSSHPVVHLPVVPRVVLHRPGVTGRGDLLHAVRRGVEVEGQQVTVGVLRVGLMEDGFTCREGDGGRVVKAPDTGQGAEVMIEGPVLHHEDHHVLDVPERTASGCRLGQDTLEIGGHERDGGTERRGARRRREQAAAGQRAHRFRLRPTPLAHPAPRGSRRRRCGKASVNRRASDVPSRRS